MRAFTSESVTEGHPDKICDQISDAILDHLIELDPYSRVAVETLAARGIIHVAGEVTTSAKADITNETKRIVREVLHDIGYASEEVGLDADSVRIITSLSKQSLDIAKGIDEQDGEHGAGDQGMMFGYACDETKELMPLPIILAHRLARRLATVRKSGALAFLRPDGKSQVTVEYEHGEPKRISAIVISAQHDPEIAPEALASSILLKVITPICKSMMDDATRIFINPTGRFVIGGPQGDTGLTGRKIIVDTYGGIGHHGGGAFSGKDPTKVDRSAAYMARYVAKNIVAAGLARKCEVQLSYAIGIAQPTSVHIETFGTQTIDQEQISFLVRKHFPLTPSGIITHLDLRHPMYRATAKYGHFGRQGFPWERTDKAEALRRDSIDSKH